MLTYFSHDVKSPLILIKGDADVDHTNIYKSKE